MSSVTEVVLGLQAFADVGANWGATIARAAAMWDINYTLDRQGGRGWFDLFEEEQAFLGDERASSYRQWFRHPFEWWPRESPEIQYLRDLRASRLAGQPIYVRSLTYENPVELVVGGAGLALTGAIWAAKFVRDWSANRRIALAEARKAEAEARAAETYAAREEVLTAFVTDWLTDEARRTSTPLPISEMAAIASLHNFKDLRRVIERPVTLGLPPGLDPAEDDSPEE